MRIILKFLLRNIKEKKLRTILILLSITLSTALLFSTITISGTFEKMFMNQFKKSFGSSEIMIYADPLKNIDPFFEEQETTAALSKVDYMIGVVRGNGEIKDQEEKKQVILGGYLLSDLERMHGVTFDKKASGDFTGNKVIIGAGDAKQYNLNLGDTIEIKIQGENHTLTIYAIAASKNIFQYDGHMTAILPRETLAELYGSPHKVNTIYVKTTNDKEVSNVLDTLSLEYDDYIVKTTITKAEIKANVGGMTSTFSIMLILVVFISIFIIFTSFKVITVERLPMVGTFRSIGATRKMTDFILLGESLLYGVIGGVIGSGLGIFILNQMVNTMSYNEYTGVQMQIDLVYGIEHFLIAFLSAVVLSVISALIPIVKVSKIPLRNIVLGNIREETRNHNIRVIFGILCLAFSIGYINFSPSYPNFLMGSIMITLMSVGIILLVPAITKLLVKVLERINRYFFGNEGVIAARNLRDNKNIVNNITLLTIGIASLFMINIVSQSVAKEVVNVFNDATYDIVFASDKADDDVINRIEAIDGVTEALGNYQIWDIKIKEKNDYVRMIWGVNPDNFFDYWEFTLLGDKDEYISELKSGKNVILPNAVKNKFGLSEGDTITLIFNDKEVEYKVIGFTSTLMNNGDFIIISEENLKEETGIYYYTDINIKTNGNLEEIKKSIQEEFENDQTQIVLMKEFKEANLKSNNQLFILLQGFSMITMVIGIFGIFNNYLVSFMSRKRSLAVYKSIGMSRKQVLKMLLVEAINGGLIGGVTGVIGGLLFLNGASYVTKAIGLPIPIYINYNFILISIVSGILLSMIASLLPSLKSSKLNIIEAIKYE